MLTEFVKQEHYKRKYLFNDDYIIIAKSYVMSGVHIKLIIRDTENLFA